MARILIIDDDGDVRETVVRLLELDGHEIAAPPSSRDVSAAIEAGDYDLVVTDVIMPEMDGIEVVRKVRKARPNCPILAISGGSSSMSSRTLLHMVGALGADATMKKPFSRAELQAAIGALLVGGGF
ncbi:response regulator transcription factor [Desertibaculum subflavum]|uniref:response regulator transcription factor n=1 Tax=Desertibaculum subflavum TaxID=2268458 RepID=UPI000E661CF8